MTAVIYSVITMICILIGFFFTREHIDASEDGEVHVKNVPLKVALPAMLKKINIFSC